MTAAEDIQSRATTAGKAQDAFLWLLLILGLFYWFLDEPQVLALGEKQQPIQLPLFALPLPRVAVWATAAHVLFLVLLAYHGALRRTVAAQEQWKALGPKERELELPPNALDYAISTSLGSPQLLKKVLGFAYPAYLTVFLLQGGWLTVQLAQTRARIDGRLTLIALAVALGLITSYQTGAFWLERWRRARSPA
jgi:hypothetical protein